MKKLIKSTITLIVFMTIMSNSMNGQNAIWSLPPLYYQPVEFPQPLPIPPEAGPPDPAEVYYFLPSESLAEDSEDQSFSLK